MTQAHQLTPREHAEYGKDPRGFEERHKIDLPALIARLNAAFELKQRGRIA